jgi:hypothetical protein
MPLHYPADGRIMPVLAASLESVPALLVELAGRSELDQASS